MLPTAAADREKSVVAGDHTFYSSRSPLIGVEDRVLVRGGLAAVVAGAAVPTYFRTQSYCSQPFSG